MRGRIHNAYQPKICQDGFHIICDRSVYRYIICVIMQQDVAGFDIAMDHPLPVSIIEGRGQSLEKTCDLIEWSAFLPLVQAAQVIRERGTSQMFHHNIRVTIDNIEIKNLDNIGMPQTRHRLCH